MNVTFCGHARITNGEPVRAWLFSVTQALIERGATTFYLGGYGSFDALAAEVLRKQKEKYPDIELILVRAYLQGEMDGFGYDDSIYPPLESVPLRFAISKRNQWMVQRSDVVVAYVTHDWGGAATTLRYAKGKKKEIILYTNKATAN